MSWKPWLHGLISAFIGGGANVVATIVIDPDVLAGGLHKAGALWVASGVISAALYLKQSPLPNIEGKQ